MHEPFSINVNRSDTHHLTAAALRTGREGDRNAQPDFQLWIIGDERWPVTWSFLSHPRLSVCLNLLLSLVDSHNKGREIGGKGGGISPLQEQSVQPPASITEDVGMPLLLVTPAAGNLTFAILSIPPQNCLSVLVIKGGLPGGDMRVEECVLY